VAQFLALSQQVAKLQGEMRRKVFTAKNTLPFLQPGRLLRIQGVWTALVNFQRASQSEEGVSKKKPLYVIDVLGNCKARNFETDAKK
jgi:hypothetical protein